MKRAIQREVAFCDAVGCEQEANHYAYCLRCGKEYCNPHRNELCVIYAVSARPSDFINSKAACYCRRPCDVALCESKADALHNALTRVRELAEEYERFKVVYDYKAGEANDEVLKRIPEMFRFLIPSGRRR